MQQSRRHNVSSACSACRKSKVKCNGVQPKCDRCMKKSIRCSYQSENDKRKIPVHSGLGVLTRRVLCLEDFIKQLGLEVPAMAPGEHSVMLRVMRLHHNGIDSDNTGHMDGYAGVKAPEDPSSDITAPSASSLEPYLFNQSTQEDLDGSLWQDQEQRPHISEELGCLPDTIPSSWSDIYTLGFSSNYLDTSLFNLQHGPRHSAIDQDDRRDNVSEICKQDPLGQLSDRMGHMGLMDDGQLRYFGATSNFNLVGSLQAEVCVISPPSKSAASETPDEFLDESTERQLEELYFRWQNASHCVVDEQMYYHSKTRWSTQGKCGTLYSPLLQMSICTIGALFYQDGHPRTLADSLAHKARSLVEKEIDSPKVATVQGLAILSDYEASATHDSRGWLYSGMAMRIAFDLGLHTDMNPCISSGKLTKEEAKARCLAFWGTFVVNHVWGFYLGRPHVSYGNITVNKPTTYACLDGNTFSPIPPIIQRSEVTELIFEQWIHLCEVMDKPGNTLYGSPATFGDAVALEASKTSDYLHKWKLELSETLQVDLAQHSVSAQELPELLLLHMHCFQILIYIHRPFTSNSPTLLKLISETPLKQSRTICIESASAIAILLSAYKTSHTMNRISTQATSIIFSAAVILLGTITNLSVSDDQDLLTEHLEVCCDALAEMGAYLENASRALDLLLTIKRVWTARLITNVNKQRPRNTQ